MNTLTLNKPKQRSHRERVILSVAPRKYDFLMELLSSFNFVRIEENDGDSREQIIANLKEVAKELKLIKEGKFVPEISARALFEEL